MSSLSDISIFLDHKVPKYRPLAQQSRGTKARCCGYIGGRSHVFSYEAGLCSSHTSLWQCSTLQAFCGIHAVPFKDHVECEAIVAEPRWLTSSLPLHR